MSRGFNQCTFIGNLGDDPEIRYTQSGVPIANFSIAVNEQWKDKNGEKQERVEWVKCVAFDKLADIVGEYLAKGNPVFVQGRLQTDRVEDRDGGPDKFFTKIILDKVHLISSGDRDGRRDHGREDRPARDERGGREERGRSTGNTRREPPPRGRGGRDDDGRSSERGGSSSRYNERPPARDVASPRSRDDEPFPDDDIPF